MNKSATNDIYPCKNRKKGETPRAILSIMDRIDQYKDSNLRKITFSDFLCQYLDWFILIFDSNTSNFCGREILIILYHQISDISLESSNSFLLNILFDSICPSQSLEDTQTATSDNIWVINLD